MKNLKESILDESILDTDKNIQTISKTVKEFEPFFVFADSAKRLAPQSEIDDVAQERHGKRQILGILSGDVPTWDKKGDELKKTIEYKLFHGRKTCVDMFGNSISVGDFAIHTDRLGNLLRSLIKITSFSNVPGLVNFKQIRWINIDDGEINLSDSAYEANCKDLVVIPKNKLNDFVTKFDLSWL